jgi:hypothetical protein
MKTIDGDLLEGDWDVAMHCANAHKVMGSGVALALRVKWPQVEQADNAWDAAPEDRLGSSTIATLPDNRLVVNLYGQVGVGCDGNPLNRNCSYDHLYNSIFKACEAFDNLYDGYFPIKIGVPYKMGCDRAGGSWRVVEAILEDMEHLFNVEFIVYKLNPTNTKNQSSIRIPL